MTKGVATFTEQEKERAQALIRLNPQITIAELERKFKNISDTTLARWRREIQAGKINVGQEKESTEEGGTDEKPQRLTDKQRLQFLERQNEDFLRTIKIQNIQFVYMRKYAKASDNEQRKDIQIQYLVAMLAEYGCDNPELLDVEEPAKGE